MIVISDWDYAASIHRTTVLISLLWGIVLAWLIGRTVYFISKQRALAPKSAEDYTAAEWAGEFPHRPPNAFECVCTNPDPEAETAYHKLRMFHQPDMTDDPGNLVLMIDKPRVTEIASDLGPRAKITWKYNSEKMQQRFRTPVFKFGKEQLWYWGDMPSGIEDKLRGIARTFYDVGSFDPDSTTDRRLKTPKVVYEDFDEQTIRARAKDLPIDIVGIRYEDRRPRAEPAEPPFEIIMDAVRLGMTIPAPVPAVPPGTPYWEIPKPELKTEFRLPYAARDKTTYILGQSGMGKSTAMQRLIQQDIADGKGVGIIDPHGDLAEWVLNAIPRSRRDSAIYFDPIRSPIGIDFFAAKDDIERDLITDHLFTVFNRLTSETGDRTHSVLRESLQLLVRYPGAVFFDLYRLLTDERFRNHVVEVVNDPARFTFWRSVYPGLPHPSTEQPLLSRLEKFGASESLRRTVSTASKFSFYEAIRRRQIVVCNLSEAAIGEHTSWLLGALLVSQFQVAAHRQGAFPREQRLPFYLFVDEFHHFTTSAFDRIISGERKFGLCLTIANQYLDQLEPGTRSAVQSAQTRMYFRLQDDDAKRMGTTLGERYSARDLLNLDEFECVVRPGKPDNTRKVRIDLPSALQESHAEYIVERTQALFPPRKREVATPASPQPGLSGPPDD